MDAVNWIISGGATGLLLIGFSFWVKNWIIGIEKKMSKIEENVNKNRESIDEKLIHILDDFRQVVSKLGEGVAEMRGLVAIVKTQHGEQIAGIRDTLTDHRKWLDEVDARIDIHGNRLTEIETTCKMVHKK